MEQIRKAQRIFAERGIDLSIGGGLCGFRPGDFILRKVLTDARIVYCKIKM